MFPSNVKKRKLCFFELTILNWYTTDVFIRKMRSEVWLGLSEGIWMVKNQEIVSQERGYNFEKR